MDNSEPLDVWLAFDEPNDEEASHEANTYLTDNGRYRVEWYSNAVGLVSRREFSTYDDAAEWLTNCGYQDFTS
jgi:hypothetical protein